MAYTKGYRYGVVPGTDNQYAIPHKAITKPTYAATIAVAPDAEDTLVDVALTGDATINSAVVKPFAGDKLRFMFDADGSARTVTFNTGFITNATLVCGANKRADIQFEFSRAAEKWVEVSRFVEA